MIGAVEPQPAAVLGQENDAPARLRSAGRSAQASRGDECGSLGRLRAADVVDALDLLRPAIGMADAEVEAIGDGQQRLDGRAADRRCLSRLLGTDRRGYGTQGVGDDSLPVSQVQRSPVHAWIAGDRAVDLPTRFALPGDRVIDLDPAAG